MPDNLIIDGDSQAAVRLAVTDPLTWGAIVAGWHGWTHTNCAVGGATTRGSNGNNVLARLPATLGNPGSHYVLQIGANNAFITPAPSPGWDYSQYWTAPKTSESGITVQQTLDDLTAIRSQVLAAGKTMTLVTPWAFFSTPEFQQFQFYVDAMFDWGALNSVCVVDAYHLQHELWWCSAPNIAGAPNMWDIYEADYQHPSVAGHALIAQQFRKARYCASPLYIP